MCVGSHLLLSLWIAISSFFFSLTSVVHFVGLAAEAEPHFVALWQWGRGSSCTVKDSVTRHAGLY